MSDADRAIANGVWRWWKTGSGPAVFLVLMVVGVALGPDWRPSSPQEAVRQEQQDCAPLPRSAVTSPAEREAWNALVDAGWHDEGHQLVAPGCRGVVKE
jgi:hypothetical protein